MFKLFDKILMWWNRRYFCKEDLKKGKCSSDLKRECCMYRDICKLGYENKDFKEVGNMSIDRNFYVIAGYDLDGYKTDKYEDWSWTEEGEKYRYYQRKGYIQLFDDPMNGCHLYFGYILAEGDMYEFKTTKFDINEVQRQEPFVRIKLRQLIDKGVIDEAIMSKPLEYKVIVFEECR